MRSEYPTDLTRVYCQDEECGWVGQVDELVVMIDNDGSHCCVCPECADIIFVEYHRDKHEAIRKAC